MNSHLTDFFRGLQVGLHSPPWAHDTVRPGFRVLAWILFILSMTSFVLVSLMTIHNDGDIEWVGILLLILFFLLYMGRVAITGRAPAGWVPWR